MCLTEKHTIYLLFIVKNTYCLLTVGKGIQIRTVATFKL